MFARTLSSLAAAALLAACAGEHEAGCVQVKRYSKAGKIALRAGAEACVVAHEPTDQAALVALVNSVDFRRELRDAGPVKCDLLVSVDGTHGGQHYRRSFECAIDVAVLDECLESARSNVDVGACTEQSIAVLSTR